MTGNEPEPPDVVPRSVDLNEDDVAGTVPRQIISSAPCPRAWSTTAWRASRLAWMSLTTAMDTVSPFSGGRGSFHE